MSSGYSRETHGEVSSDEKVKANIGPPSFTPVCVLQYLELCFGIHGSDLGLQPNPGA